MEEKISKTFRRSRAVGAAFGIFDKGKLDFFYYGFTNRTKVSSISESSIFELGPITKIFTTTILMDFVDKKIVSLDDPIFNYLPFLKKSKIKEITLEHLATHYSSLPSFPTNFKPADVKNPYADYTIENLYAFLEHYQPQRPAGEQFEYSNLGLGLLGHILCLISKKTYEQLVSSTIFAKLSMKTTSSLLTSSISDQLCHGHFLQQPITPWDCKEAFVGAVSIRSNIKDMMQFLIANLTSSSLYDLFQKCHRPIRPSGYNESVGLGWFIDHSLGTDIIWHDGITAGFQSFIGFSLEQKKGVVALTNSSISWITPLSFEIITSSINPTKSQV